MTETARDKICPLHSAVCKTTECAWWCVFTGDCSIPLLAGMLSDSEICRNIFEEEANHDT